MKTNQKPIWITIADEANKKLPAGKKKLPAENPDRVTHKGFWIAGFVALLVFSFALSIPQQVSKFIKAELFDGEFEDLVPSQEGNLFFSESDLPEDTPSENVDEDFLNTPQEASPILEEENNGIQPESDAVSIDIQPLDLPETNNEEALTDDEAALLDAQPEPIDVEPQVDTNLQSLLESLNAQLDDLKKDNQEKAAEIEALMFQLTNNPDANLHGSAGDQTSPLPDDNSNIPFTGEGEYRYNTHTVTVSPYDVLAQNRQAASQFNQLALQANMAQTTISNAAQNNLALANLQGQPASGPREIMLLALILTAVGILSFGIYRSSRRA